MVRHYRYILIAIVMIAPAAYSAAAELARVNAYSQQVIGAFDPSWSASEKQLFVRSLGGWTPETLTNLQPALRLAPSEVLDENGVPRNVLSPRTAAAQAGGEMIARPRFIPSVIEAVRQSAVSEREDIAASLERFSIALKKQTPGQRKAQLLKLMRLRRELYAQDLNKGDLILWLQNHLNALYDGEQRYQFGPPVPEEFAQIFHNHESLQQRLTPIRFIPAPHDRPQDGNRWDADAVPDSFHSGRSLVSVAIPTPGKYFLPIKGYNGDLPTYIEGDVTRGAYISGQHNDVLISGDVGEDTHFSLREGLLSARSFKSNSTVNGSRLIVVSDAHTSGTAIRSEKLSSYTNTVIEVPEEHRADIFLWLTGRKGQGLKLKRPVGENLDEILNKLKKLDLLKAVYYAGELVK
jgi:hypothetical protein